MGAPRIGRLLTAALDVLTPPICSICAQLIDEPDPGVLCRDCRATLEPCGHAVCPTCGRRKTYGSGNRCPHCPPRPVYFESARAALVYSGALPEAFLAYKYQGHSELGPELGRIMAQHLADYAHDDPPRDVLMPVPLHLMRRMWRGYNQSRILAQAFSNDAAIPVMTGALVRVRHTPRQALQPAYRRQANVRGAFRVPNRPAVAGLHIGLVDDLLTTGHTVNECARVLMQAGAASVRVLALGRA